MYIYIYNQIQLKMSVPTFMFIITSDPEYSHLKYLSLRVDDAQDVFAQFKFRFIVDGNVYTMEKRHWLSVTNYPKVPLRLNRDLDDLEAQDDEFHVIINADMDDEKERIERNDIHQILKLDEYIIDVEYDGETIVEQTMVYEEDEGKLRLKRWKFGNCAVCQSKVEFVCGGCKNIAYCGAICQAKHWGQHKNIC